MSDLMDAGAIFAIDPDDLDEGTEPDDLDDEEAVNGEMTPDAFAALPFSEQLAMREEMLAAGTWAAFKHGDPVVIPDDLPVSSPIDEAPEPVRDVSVARHQLNRLAKILDANGAELQEDAQARLDALMIRAGADRPDPVALAGALQILQTAKDEMDQAQPFGRVISRGQARTAAGGIRITERDTSGRERVTEFGSEELDQLESRDFSRRAVTGDALPEDPWGVTAEDISSWPMDRRLKFKAAHPDVWEARKVAEA